MKSREGNRRVIIRGGGTGGHVFPAIAIAGALKEQEPGIGILFVGARDRLEMEKVPEAGYEIRGLPVAGLQRKLTIRNIGVAINLIKSLRMASEIIRSFKPDAAVGVGGYASGPVMWAAARKKIPTLIQEQNSFAGVTNRLLARRVDKICVAYGDMDRYFPGDKIVFTGNPVRDEIRDMNRVTGQEGLEYFGLPGNAPVLLVLGGSLGAGTINNSVLEGMDKIRESGVRLLWQCGDHHYQGMLAALEGKDHEHVVLKPFIDRMELAYKAADVIIARAGALTISELCFAGKPVILVPSPNVAEDHQTKNAMALVRNSAALHISDSEAGRVLIKAALDLMGDREKRKWFSDNIRKLAVADSARKISGEILALMN